MRLRHRRGVAWVAAGLALARPAAAEAALRWTPAVPRSHGDAVTALAVEPGSGRLAVGDERGVLLADAGGGFRRVLHRGPVHDLVFLPRDALADGGARLLVATASGLWSLDGEGRSVAHSPAPGAEARDVRRLAWAPGALALGTADGVFLTVDLRRFLRASLSLPVGPAPALALRPQAAGFDCLAAVDGRLWGAHLTPREASARGAAAREPVFVARDGPGPVDIAFGLAGWDAVVVTPDAFAARESAGGSWREIRPTLPPGAEARRIASAHGSLWLATDRGLLVADALEGPWRRSPAPAGTGGVAALAASADALFVAAGDRVLVARFDAQEVPAGPTPEGVDLRTLRTPEGDPPIEHVHRAALRYLDLGTGGPARLRRGVARRGWLPLVTLRVASDWNDDRTVDFDQAFVSGEVRHLVDRDRDRSRDLASSLTFTWDLGDVAFHPEQIDVSAETRQLIKLRDDVLDEVTQLYFERRRVLAELAARPDAAPAEVLRLRLRAAELAAGIDAWTGGWFSAARGGAAP